MRRIVEEYAALANVTEEAFSFNLARYRNEPSLPGYESYWEIVEMGRNDGEWWAILKREREEEMNP